MAGDDRVVADLEEAGSRKQDKEGHGRERLKAPPFFVGSSEITEGQPFASLQEILADDEAICCDAIIMKAREVLYAQYSHP